MTSGLVVHLSADSRLAEAATAIIRGRSGLLLGQRTGQRLPVVAESVNPEAAENDTQWIRQLPGVDHVDVAFVHLEE